MVEDERVTLKEVSQIAFLCLLWYTMSSGNNVIVKAILNDFPYPMTVTMVQLLSITLYSGPIFSLIGVRRSVSIEWHYYLKLIVPLAFGKFFASFSSHVSMWKVPVSYAHTVKATTPLFVVILSRIILGEKQTLKVYLSLIPIIVGVFIATITELSFDLIGMISALLSTLVFSLQNIFSKKVLADTSIHHLRLLHLLARLSLFFFIPMWLLFDFRKFMVDDSLLKNTDPFMLIFLLFLDGACNFGQNIIAFNMLSLVSSLTYAVCNTSKRIFVISVSLIIIGNPVTVYNVLGMGIAILGVLCYNKAKYDSIQAKRKEKLLPYTNVDTKIRSSIPGHSQFTYNMSSQKTGNLIALTQNGIANGTSRLSLKGKLFEV